MSNQPQGGQPGDPFSTLGDAAISMHELYKSLQVGGFSRLEAMELMKAIMLEPQRIASGPCPHCGRLRGA